MKHVLHIQNIGLMSRDLNLPSLIFSDDPLPLLFPHYIDLFPPEYNHCSIKTHYKELLKENLLFSLISEMHVSFN